MIKQTAQDAAFSRLVAQMGKNLHGTTADGTRFGIVWQNGRTFVVNTLGPKGPNGERGAKESWTTEQPAEALARIVSAHGPVEED